jgi:hypothetical protein
MADENIPFPTSLGLSLSPNGFKKLRYGGVTHAFVYMVLLLLFGLAIKAMFLIPLTVDVLTSLQNVSAKFEKASFAGSIETNEQVLIPTDRPLVQIDTAPNAVRKGSVLITEKSLSFGDMADPTTIIYPDFSGSQDNSKLLSGLFIVGIFILPSIILLLFLGGFIKCILLVILLGAIGLLVSSSKEGSLRKRNAFTLACYALAPMVFIESIVVPLRFGEFLFPLFSILGITFYAVSISATLILYFIWMLLSKSEKYAFG